MSSGKVERVCEICGSGSSNRIETYCFGEWPLVKCTACDFVYLKSVPAYEVLSTEFAWEKQRAIEAKRRQQSAWGAFDAATRWRLQIGKLIDDRILKSARHRGGNTLNIGCGGGCGPVPPGEVPYGIEISEALASRAVPEFKARGGAVFHGPAVDGLDAFEGIGFSAVYMRSYLEHEAQPRLVLQKSFDRLLPGGTVHLRVPNYGSPNRVVMGRRWCGFRFPDHVNYFTSKSLRQLAENIGFDYAHHNRWSLFDDNLIVVLTKPAG